MDVIKRREFRNRELAASTFLFVLFSFFGTAADILAHGDEDHGAGKPATVNTGGSSEVRSVRLKGFEVTLKNSALEPDTESSARLFVTRFATNEAVPNAKVILTVEREGDKTEDIIATATDTPGTFLVKIPPIPEGTARLTVRVESEGKTDNASLGEITIAPHIETSATETSWAQTLLYWLLAGLALAFIGATAWWALRRWQLAQRGHEVEIQQEVVSA